MPDFQIDYELLARELIKSSQMNGNGNGAGTGLKHTQPTGTPTTVYGHGRFGIFAQPGLDPDVYSALPMPQAGLLSMLPWFKSRFSNPLYAIVTGQTDNTGSNKVNVCDDAPVAGLLKVCDQTAVFGRWELATREFELNRLGLLRDNADPQ